MKNEEFAAAEVGRIDKIGTYQFMAEPFHCDFSQRLFMGHLGNHLLNAADFHSTDRGFGMKYLLSINRSWVLSRLAIEMEEMPPMYTRFNVETWVESAMRYFTSRNFRVVGLDGRVYGYGRSIWAMIDTESRQPTDIYAIDNGAIDHWIVKDKECPIDKGGRVKMSDGAELVRTIDMQYNDVDINGHINSVKYIEHVLDLWPLDWYRQHRLHRLEIAYVAEAHQGDKLSFYREETAQGECCVRIVKSSAESPEPVEVCRCKVVFKSFRHLTNKTPYAKNKSVMKYLRLTSLIAGVVCCSCLSAYTTLPPQGTLVSPTDKHIQYVGRISFANPERPAFNYPGTQVIASFEGTSLKLMAKPGSGYFMAQIDGAEPFKVAFTGKQDSIVSLATALPDGRHTVRFMYAIEGFEFHPEFWGFVLDSGRQLIDSPALPERKLEFVGNSITCGYGNEDLNANEHFDYATENHYYSYAALTARQLGAQHWVVARSGIGAYRNFGGPKAGTPDSNMPAQYLYTAYAPEPKLREGGGLQAEKWDFARYQPDVVCINLGTNDLSTNNYDAKLLKQGYQQLLKLVRDNNPRAKIVLLCGSMLNGKELDIARRLLNEVQEEARKAGDKEVYRFDFTPQNGDLGYGADWHPSVWQHEKMAAELTAYLRGLMKWF